MNARLISSTEGFIASKTVRVEEGMLPVVVVLLVVDGAGGASVDVWQVATNNEAPNRRTPADVFILILLFLPPCGWGEQNEIYCLYFHLYKNRLGIGASI